jgi:hypothetical protein
MGLSDNVQMYQYHQVAAKYPITAQYSSFNVRFTENQ